MSQSHSDISPLPNHLFAVCRLHFTIFRSRGAAVAAIVLAAFVVVPIVAVAVSFVRRRYAPGRLAKVVRVDALALKKSESFNLERFWSICAPAGVYK